MFSPMCPNLALSDLLMFACLISENGYHLVVLNHISLFTMEFEYFVFLKYVLNFMFFLPFPLSILPLGFLPFSF